MVEPALLALAGWLETIGLARWASATAWAYPAANVLHVLGTVALIGAIGVVDLRIAGLWRRLPLAELSRALTPLAVAGLSLQLASGLVLFAADGDALAGSAMFHRKLLLIALALGNVALFYALRTRSPAAGEPSVAVRASAVLSLGLWLGVATYGRLIAYY